MKKILSLLGLILLFTLVACGDAETEVPSTPAAPETQDPVAPEMDDNDDSDPAPSTPPASETNGSSTDDPYNDPMLPSDGSEEDGYGSGGSTTPTPPADDDEDGTGSGGSTAPTPPADDDEDEFETDENGQLLLTLSQLSQFDGKDGRRAFIAVAGIVYEVTNSPRWRNGIHNGDSSIAAGNDLTSQIDSISPHGRRVLDNIPRVGRIVQD